MSTHQRFRYILPFTILITLFTTWVGCTFSASEQAKSEVISKKVEIIKTDNGFELYRNGEPYLIKGAGGYKYLEKIAAYGGNSVRIWHSDDAGKILDKAHQLGLSVTLGLWLEREREGFNYYDKQAVITQKERIRKEVLKYKDHPALLMWGIGNELYAEGSNVKVWDAVNEIAEMIHEIDPNHPTTTTVMNVPEKIVNLISERCPALDVLSVNSFGSLVYVKDEMGKTDWKGPYIITEFGARGYWETFQTEWGAPLEQTSSQKAEYAMYRYKESVLKDTSRCLGSYVFFWGYKHETTPTWFSTIYNNGEETELVHVMQELWTGKPSLNKSPYISSILLNNKYDYEPIYLKPGMNYHSKIYAFDPDQDTLQYVWEVLPEFEQLDGNASKQVKPTPLTGLLKDTNHHAIQITTPRKEGAYRLFCYIRDGKDNIATANIPFYVKP